MRGILLVMSDCVPGADADYHDWYDRVHLPDVLSVPGFTAARRYAAVPSMHGELPTQRYLAVYDIEADDLGLAQKALSAAAATMELSPAFDRASMAISTYELISEATPQ